MTNNKTVSVHDQQAMGNIKGLGFNNNNDFEEGGQPRDLEAERTEREEWEGHLENLSRTPFAKRYEEIQSFDHKSVVEDFQEAAHELIEEVKALKGDMYSEEGKKKHLRNELEKLAETYKEHSKEYIVEYNQDVQKLQNSIERRINKNDDDDISDYEANRKLLKNSEHEAKIKNKILFTTDGRELRKTFDDFVKDVEFNRNKSFGRYLLNNSYVFMERAENLNVSEKERAEIINNIMTNKHKLERLVLSSKKRALSAMGKKINGKRYTNAGNERLIDGWLKQYIRDYS